MIYPKHPIRSLLTSAVNHNLMSYYVSCYRAPDKLRIYVFYAMKMSKNAFTIRSECNTFCYDLAIYTQINFYSVCVIFIVLKKQTQLYIKQAVIQSPFSNGGSPTPEAQDTRFKYHVNMIRSV
jgi:hypothetical protein